MENDGASSMKRKSSLRIVIPKKRNSRPARVEAFGVGRLFRVGDAHHHDEVQKTVRHVAGLPELRERGIVDRAVDVALRNPADGGRVEVGIEQVALELLRPADLERQMAA